MMPDTVAYLLMLVGSVAILAIWKMAGKPEPKTLRESRDLNYGRMKRVAAIAKREER